MITGSRRRCPHCQSTDVVPILYGEPDEEGRKAANVGLVHLGGTVKTRDRPEWHCNQCNYEWERPSELV